MLVLGIESSCDETAAAVIEDGRVVRSNIIATQIDIHRKFGGVVPEIASRQHIGSILPVIEDAMAQAEVSFDDLDALAVTVGPGLVGSLLVGISAAKGLSLATGLPLYPVHHIAGHIAANYLAFPELEPPFLCLVVSGGHSHIIHVEDYVRFRIIARTRDDAAGEAFDKVARAVGLGYPGGPLIDRAARDGDPNAIRFPRTTFDGDVLDFSFSGVKTAALNYLNHLDMEAKKQGRTREDLLNVADFAAGFQQAVTGVLTDNLMTAAERLGIDDIALAGGVAANGALRAQLSDRCSEAGKRFYCPPFVYCTDNAAMIGSMGYYMYCSGLHPADDELDAIASLPIDQWHEDQAKLAGI